MTLTSAVTLDTQGNNIWLSGGLSGSGSLTKIGTGTLTLSATNTYGGGTTLQAGTLNFGNVAAMGSGAIAFTGGATLQGGVSGGTLANNIAIGPSLTGTFDSQGNSVTLGGVISGSAL